MATCHCNVPWPYCFVAHNGLQQHSLGKFNFGLRDLPWLAKICRPMRTKISKQDRTWNITDMMGLYLLTYSMVQSPSWEANWFAASQEIPRILWNANVHYRTHKRPPSVPILCQPNPVHIPTSHLLEIHPNIIHPSTARSPQWSLSLRFPHQDPIRPLSSPIRATCPAYLILLDFITRTILGEEYRSFSSSLCNLLHSPVTSSLLMMGLIWSNMMGLYLTKFKIRCLWFLFVMHCD